MTDEIGPIRQALAGRYEIEAEIGFGGMAKVYRARDLRHPRSVALKVLRQDVGSAGAAERFLQEIRTAATLQHPHIVSLIDSGQVGNQLYFLMPLIDGETLRSRLQREGPLPLELAVRYAREVADALGYAHERGFVHRDIKPENIFIAADHAIVGDFGIARALDAAGMRLTETGLAIGTPLYMSPEQALASRSVDGRTDQYALACVLYEMIAGTPPFDGANVYAVMARHSSDAVPPLSTVRAVPPPLERAIERALAKAPADRWPTMAAFANALRSPFEPGDSALRATPTRALIGAGAVLAVLALGVATALWRTASVSQPANAVVAVLPFEFEGDRDRAFVARGLSDDLVAALVRANLQIPDLAGGRLDPEREPRPLDVARDLGATSFVTAKVRIQQNRLVVTARLTDARTSRVQWQHTFSGELVVDGHPRELFAIQDSMGTEIVAALLPQLQPDERGAVQRGMRTRDLAAYELVNRGQDELRNLSLSGSERAFDHFSRAIGIDSGYADAWLGLAHATDGLLQLSARPPTELVFILRGAIERAAALDSFNPDAMVLRARFRLNHEFDAGGYEREMRRALSRYSRNADVHFAYGQDLHTFGLRDSALVVLQRAAALDPSRPFILVNVATALLSLGRLDEAKALHARMLERDSTQWLSYTDLAIAAHAERRFEDAARLIDRAREIQSDSPWILGHVVMCSQPASPEAAQRAMDKLLAHARRGYVQHVHLAQAHLGLGKQLEAMDALEASMRVRDRDFYSKLAWGEFEALRGQPRYERIIQAAGLSESMRSADRRRHRGRDLAVCGAATSGDGG